MIRLANPLQSETWNTAATAATAAEPHYYGCPCPACADAFLQWGTVSDPATAPVTQSAQAANLPYYVSAVLYPQDWRWNADSPHGTAVTVTYSFMSANPGAYGGFRVFNDTEKAAARETVAEWAKVCDVAFKEVSSGGQIAFGNADVGNASGMTLWQGTTGRDSGMKTTHADVYMSSTMALTYTDGSFGTRAILHEVGHALGLKHTFDASGPTLSGTENTAQYSVMSYSNPPSTPNVLPDTPQLYDIAAAQYLYGANVNAQTGDTVYQFPAGAAKVMTIWDGGGTDAIDCSGQSVAQTIDLRQGAFSNIGVYNNAAANNTVAIAYGAVIEKAFGGSGDDTLIGNDSANVLLGGNGADKLTGGGGADAFCYGATTQGGDSIADFVSGTDHLDFAAKAFGLSAGILGAGQFAHLSSGYDGGNAGNVAFVFDGSGALWFDGNGAALGGMVKMATLSGGNVAASDIHLVDDFTTAPASTLPISSTPEPTPVASVLTGTSGNDTLSGAGGDITMKGGLGHDTYVVDSLGDVAVEYANEGIDTVRSSLSYILGAYTENLTLTGNAAINGAGSSWHNVIIGNGAANVLTGRAGMDVLTGGAGADTFKYLSPGDGTFISVNATRGTAKGDVITDFTGGVDKLTLDHTAFALTQGMGKAGINVSEISTAYNGVNGGGSDYLAGRPSLIIDSTHTLYYDANGKGAGYTVLASAQTYASMHASDIIIA